MANEVQNVAVDVLKVHPRNEEFFDDISGQEYENFKKSIAEEGIISEIIVAPDMTIISGHQRYKAAKELGIKMVPIRIREDLIDEDKKLKVLLAANFGRTKNDEAKQRKVATEYVRLCGYENGEMGNGRKKEAQNGLPTKMTLDEIAIQLGTSKTNLKRALSIERNLTDSMKELLDTGVISKTLAADVITALTPEEQEELISSLDTTKRITRREMEKYIKEMKEATPVPSDYEQIKENLKISKKDIKDLNDRLQKAKEEALSLKERIAVLEDDSLPENFANKLKQSSIKFAGKVANFLEDIGGYVWLTDYLDQIPDFERQNYINSIEALKAWIGAMDFNINKEKGEMYYDEQ